MTRFALHYCQVNSRILLSSCIGVRKATGTYFSLFPDRQQLQLSPHLLRSTKQIISCTYVPSESVQGTGAPRYTDAATQRHRFPRLRHSQMHVPGVSWTWMGKWIPSMQSSIRDHPGSERPWSHKRGNRVNSPAVMPREGCCVSQMIEFAPYGVCSPCGIPVSL